MYNANYILVVFSVLTIAVGQILFKSASRIIHIDMSRSYFEILRANFLPAAIVFVALALYFLSTIAWVQALRTIPLSVAYTFNSLSFVLVPVAAFVIFGEQVPRYFLPGVLMIIGGVLLVSRG
jgi:multidrug transporter EmrE-like cation transporter